MWYEAFSPLSLIHIQMCIRDRWKKRCRAVSEACGLSERQYEVLMLVAQGRNAKYIEQALTISLLSLIHI